MAVRLRGTTTERVITSEVGPDGSPGSREQLFMTFEDEPIDGESSSTGQYRGPVTAPSTSKNSSSDFVIAVPSLAEYVRNGGIGRLSIPITEDELQERCEGDELSPDGGSSGIEEDTDADENTSHAMSDTAGAGEPGDDVDPGMDLDAGGGFSHPSEGVPDRIAPERGRVPRPYSFQFRRLANIASNRALLGGLTEPGSETRPQAAPPQAPVQPGNFSDGSRARDRTDVPGGLLTVDGRAEGQSARFRVNCVSKSKDVESGDGPARLYRVHWRSAPGSSGRKPPTWEPAANIPPGTLQNWLAKERDALRPPQSRGVHNANAPPTPFTSIRASNTPLPPSSRIASRVDSGSTPNIIGYTTVDLEGGRSERWFRVRRNNKNCSNADRTFWLPEKDFPPVKIRKFLARRRPHAYPPSIIHAPQRSNDLQGAASARPEPAQELPGQARSGIDDVIQPHTKDGTRQGSGPTGRHSTVSTQQNSAITSDLGQGGAHIEPSPTASETSCSSSTQAPEGRRVQTRTDYMTPTSSSGTLSEGGPASARSTVLPPPPPPPLPPYNNRRGTKRHPRHRVIAPSTAGERSSKRRTKKTRDAALPDAAAAAAAVSSAEGLLGGGAGERVKVLEAELRELKDRVEKQDAIMAALLRICAPGLAECVVRQSQGQ